MTDGRSYHPQVIDALPLLAYEEEAGEVLVKENDEAVLTATFDDLNRLTNLEVQVQPATR